jgi:hypothetical protein
MKAIYLVPGQPQPIGAGGRTLTIVNNPWTDSKNAGGFYAAPVFVGVGGTASEANQADYEIPPFTQAILPIDADATVFLSTPAGSGSHQFWNFSQTAEVLYEWSNRLVPGAQFLPLFLPFKYGKASTLAAIWSDWSTDPWPPGAPEYLLQQIGTPGAGGPYGVTRPRLAPSLPVTAVQSATANTLFNLPGAVTPPSTLQGKVIKRVTVGASAAGLFVIGDGSLTVGSPGSGEVGRLLIPAGDTRTLEMDEGLDLSWNSAHPTAAWQAYFSVAATLQITILLA